ncbi:hypothetical protein EYF80_027103 [Liparis tanakae]|uniref:Uncharacterized protein n=1 Tax=Liparis tanakae TaxID=230148 RepID=A0A4Z2HD04_9TELE|nr:hypothetical protein EYF80_027103 [Liparis tanakae]
MAAHEDAPYSAINGTQQFLVSARLTPKTHRAERSPAARRVTVCSDPGDFGGDTLMLCSRLGSPFYSGLHGPGH